MGEQVRIVQNGVVKYQFDRHHFARVLDLCRLAPLPQKAV
jgi:hypothetical protein